MRTKPTKKVAEEKSSLSAEKIISIIKEMKDKASADADEGLKSGNSVAFDVYIERAIAYHDLLVRLGVKEDSEQ